MKTLYMLLFCSILLLFTACEPKPEDDPVWSKAYSQAQSESNEAVGRLMAKAVDEYQIAFENALALDFIDARIDQEKGRLAKLRELLKAGHWQELLPLAKEAVRSTHEWQSRSSDRAEEARVAAQEFEIQYGSITNILPRLNALHAQMRAEVSR